MILSEDLKTFRMKMQKKAVTLVELLIVVIIVGILAALALPQFSGIKEGALDKEAIANLKLVAAAERIYRLENNHYYPQSGSADVISDLNTWLRLDLPRLANRNWDYKVDGGSTTFTAKAQSIKGTSRRWCITQAQDEPGKNTCTW